MQKSSYSHVSKQALLLFMNNKQSIPSFSLSNFEIRELPPNRQAFTTITVLNTDKQDADSWRGRRQPSPEKIAKVNFNKTLQMSVE